ncbi:unnamed protein product, partial [Didymodactylos carnosus]
MSKLNINFSTLAAKKFNGVFNNDFKYEDLISFIEKQLESANFTLIFLGSTITDQTFSTVKEKIVNNSLIYVVQRLDGGCSNLIDIDTHIKTISSDLDNELKKLESKAKLDICMICTDNILCYNYCCGTKLCKNCFKQTFFNYNQTLKCLICSKQYPNAKFFVSPEILQSLLQLDDAMQLTNNMDFQLCKCGALSHNTTMYSKQQCKQCQRWFCFFCNQDWDVQVKKMQNHKFTCKINCTWETKITYELTKCLYGTTDLFLPNRRCCPKCCQTGAYGKQSMPVAAHDPILRRKRPLAVDGSDPLNQDAAKYRSGDDRTNYSKMQNTNKNTELTSFRTSLDTKSNKNSNQQESHKSQKDSVTTMCKRYVPGLCGLTNI